MPDGDKAPLEVGQVITVFRSRLRAENDKAYRSAAGDMESAARAAPGFVDFKSFVADDGEQVSVATFDSEASQRAWRDDVRHAETQLRGRSDFYSKYSIQVGLCTYAADWVRTEH